jgi:hypothetical protein
MIAPLLSGVTGCLTTGPGRVLSGITSGGPDDTQPARASPAKAGSAALFQVTGVNNALMKEKCRNSRDRVKRLPG